MRKKLVAMVVAMCVLSATGCGTAAPAQSESSAASEAQVTEEPEITETPEVTEEPAATEAPEEGQNPVMNFVGNYNAADSVEALVEADGTENAIVTVTYAGSPWFHDEIVMSGKFDAETLTMDFENGTLTEYSYNADGSVRTETISYRDGKGKAVFDANDGTMTLTEHFQSGDRETVFAFGPAADMKKVTDPDHYNGVTAMDKFLIETEVAFAVRTAYLREDWNTLADMIWYPITINEKELKDKDAFLDFMKDKTVAESDWQAMDEEDLLDMFVNGQGLCMGSGQVWMNDPNYMTDKEPTLQIIAISGIISKVAPSGAEEKEESEEKKEEEKKEDEKKSESEAEQEPNSERDFYDQENVTVYGENGDSFKLYLGSDGVWREEDGTVYIKLSDTEFQVKEGTRRVTTVNPSEEEQEVNVEGDPYGAPSVIVYDENGEKHTLFESPDGYWREDDGTAYSRSSSKVFQLKDGSKQVKTYYWTKDEDDGGEEGDPYSAPAVTIYGDDGEGHKVYESSDGYWREDDGTAYVRNSFKEFQLKDGSELFYTH